MKPIRITKRKLFALIIAAAVCLASFYMVSSGCALEAHTDDLDELLRGMTVRQKVGQLFIVRPDSLGGKGATKLTDAMADALAKYPVGGVAMFKKNITSPRQIGQFIRSLNEASAIGMFIAVDEEGGQVARIANHQAFDVPKYKSAAHVGASGDEGKAMEMGRTIGGYLKEYGFNMDFAPVADVLTNKKNTVIGNRAFSSDANTVAIMAEAMAKGLKERGVIPVFKHFPGHGDTYEDSHKNVAVSRKTREDMLACEWLPFMAAGPDDCVMVAHVASPEITGDLTPATMSAEMIDILRNDLGFEGLIITDALEMGAVTSEYASGEAALTALEAGCDILLMPANLKKAFDAVVDAVESGEFSAQRLDEIVLRVLGFKRANGIITDNG